jgi:hypothetical protein
VNICHQEISYGELISDSAHATEPYCAIASATIPSAPSSGFVEDDGPGTTAAVQYACAKYPFTLTYTVPLTYTYEPLNCAPPWVTNPASVAAWSSSESSQVASAISESFANPFAQVVFRANFSPTVTLPSNSMSQTGQTVNIPTTATVSATKTSSGSKYTTAPYLGLHSLGLSLTVLLLS